jgi:membrane protein implicated in regulation of membrane protease activity
VFIVVAGIVCVSFYGEIIMTHFSVSFHIAISFLFLVSFLFAYFYWRTLRDNENIKNEISDFFMNYKNLQKKKVALNALKKE